VRRISCKSKFGTPAANVNCSQVSRKSFTGLPLLQVKTGISWPLAFNARLQKIVNVLGHFHNPPVTALCLMTSGRSALRITNKNQRLDGLYKFLYKWVVVADKPNPSRIKREGDSLETLRSWPKEARFNIGGDIQRLEDREKPLDATAVGGGISELRDRQKHVWYGVLYWLNQG
jgi:hypothetical protein